MKNASLLLLVAESTVAADLDPIVQTAVATQAHLSVLVLGAMPYPPVFAYGIEAYGMLSIPDGWPERIEATKAGLTRTARAIEASLQASGASGDVGVLCCEPAAMSPAIGRRAATCDAVLLSDDLRGDDALFDNAIHGGLFLSPAGVILNGTRARDALSPARVFVAWDIGLPAARAVHAALPLLTAAAEITIGIFDPVTSPDGEFPGSGVARWLDHHGCHVDLQQYPSGGAEIGTCILRHATEADADLIVMGAYGHSRMRQAVFGGTTRTLIAQTKMPVLLAH